MAKQKENASNSKSPIEEASEKALESVVEHEKILGDFSEALADCSGKNGINPELKQAVQEDVDSVHRAVSNLKQAYLKAAKIEDELSARYHDVQKNLNRKWYLPNPPSNTSIDAAETKNKHFAQGLNPYKLMLIIIIGSFAGVVVELLWCLVKNGYIESRSGLVYGPFNLLYGIGAAALSVALYRFRNRGYLYSFFGGMIIGSVVEYICSWAQEVILGSRSWDYSQVPFNINGRICLLYSVFWGVLGVLWIKDLYPRMSKWILKLPNKAGKIITWVLVVFMIYNCAVSGVAVLRWSQRVNGKEASNGFEEFIDERFPDERMERIYANMEFEN